MLQGKEREKEQGMCFSIKPVLVGDHLLLREFGPYGIIFVNVSVVVIVAMVMGLVG
jgi:hypothetical protein